MNEKTQFDIEIAKVVGEEVAKKALASFSDEKLDMIVITSLQTLTEKDSSYYSNKKDSLLDKIVIQKVSAKLEEKIEENLNNDDYKARINHISTEIIENVITQAKEKFADVISDRLVNYSVQPIGISIRPMIEQMMIEMLNRR